MTALKQWARRHPGKAALIEAESGRLCTYAQLDARADRAARWLVSLGLQAGDGIALLLENRPELIELAWACRRTGLYYTAINTHMTADEAAHVLRDCGARVLLASEATLAIARDALAACAGGVKAVLVGAQAPGFASYEYALDSLDESAPLPERPLGRDMLYSSGTTGRPKGIRRPMQPWARRHAPDPEVEAWRKSFSFDENAVYLSTAPFYHAAPLRYIMRTLESGGSCVSMARFDAQAALQAIERHRVTHSQWVPTMFVRLLALPESMRARHDLSSMRVAIHAAAPCPVHVKQAMLDWWGDIIHEYYAGSEGVGATSIGPLEWRRRPGSVGRAMAGRLHIVDDDGRELAAGQIGAVYFSGVASFAYHNDPEKTREAYNERGWATYGDIGHVDDEGYLYLSDRRADLIPCGGVNVYPQEIEAVLLQHPAVADAAVVGVPDAEFGEVPLAVVKPHAPPVPDKDALAQALIAHCHQHLGRLKLPRRVIFEEALPRTETGKLLRRELKARHRAPT